MYLKDIMENIKGQAINIEFPDKWKEGVVGDFVHPHFLMLNYCKKGPKQQFINLNQMFTLSFMTFEDVRDMKEYWDKKEAQQKDE